MKITGMGAPQGGYRPPETDSVSKGIQDRIDSLRKRLEKLSENDKTDAKERAKQREEINKQISELEAQLSQRRADKKNEVAKGADKQSSDRYEQSDEMSDILSADSSLKRSETVQSSQSSLSRASRTLKGEIRSDKRRGVNTEKKEAELAGINSRMEKLNASQAEETKKAGGTAKASKFAAGIEYLAGLKKQIPGTAFFIGTVSYGQTYGNSADNNFVVNPKYLEKLSDPKEREKFEESVKNLNNFSNQFRASMASRGREVISEGWFCDEDGNWGGWTVTRATNTRSHLQEMRDEADKINEKKSEAKKETEKLADKREKLRIEKNDIKEKAEKELKEKLGDKFTEFHLYDRTDHTEALFDVKA